MAGYKSLVFDPDGISAASDLASSASDAASKASDAASKASQAVLSAASVASDALSKAQVAATVSVAGRIEIATASETNVGTDTARAVSPDGLAGSIHGEKVFCIGLFEAGVSVIVVNGAVAYTIPAAMNGMNLVDVIASVHTKGITGTTDIQVRRRRAGADADMLSAKITMADEYFATDETVDTNNDDVLTGDQIYIDVDVIHTTAPLGLSVTLTFRLP